MISTQINPGTPGKHRADGNRALFAFKGLAAFLRRHRQVATVPAPVSDFMPPLEDRIALIEAIGAVHVTVDPHFLPDECGRCETERPNVTCMRVYGDDAHPGIVAPLGLVEVCLPCGVGTGGAVAQALLEALTVDHDVRVEVCA